MKRGMDMKNWASLHSHIAMTAIKNFLMLNLIQEGNSLKLTGDGHASLVAENCWKGTIAEEHNLINAVKEPQT